MVSLIVVALVLGVTSAVVVDFDGITSPSSTHTAKYDLDHETLENDPTIGTEFTTAMYEAISSSDETYAVTRVTYDYFASQQIFRFKVEGVLIEEFTVTWEGNIAFMWVVGGLEIWNGTSWESVGTISAVGEGPSYPEPPEGASVQGRMEFMASDETVTKTYTANMSDYIDNGYITVMVWAKNCHDATICTDYVKLECTPPKHYLKVVSPYSTSGGEGWYDEGTTAYATLDAGIVDHGNGTRRVFTHWSGDASGTNYTASDPIYMYQNKTAVASWKTQYSVVFDQTGLDGTAAGTVVTVNGVARTFIDLPFSMWVDSGIVISYFYSNVSSTTASKRFILTGVTGPTSPITITSPTTVTGNYKTQYKITFNQSGISPDFTGTAVTIDEKEYTINMLPVSFWWDSGSTHTFAFQSPLAVTPNAKQYVWTSTAGLSTLQSGSITVSASGSVTGYYKAQYYLSVTSPYGSPTPSSGWFDAEASVAASVTSPWPGPTDTRNACTGWTGTGSVPASGTASSVTFTITQPSSITWNWKIQYFLTVRTSPSGVVTIPGEEWYDASTNVSLTGSSVSDYRFLNWDVDGVFQGEGVTTITVNMNMPHTATAHYTQIQPLSASISPTTAEIKIGGSVTFTSTVSGGRFPYHYQWYLNGNPVSGAASNTWDFTQTSGGIYYVYLKVTDANDNVAQSETARITVTAIPVGGYSISLTRPPAPTPLICYTILLAIFSATISLIRRARPSGAFRNEEKERDNLKGKEKIPK